MTLLIATTICLIVIVIAMPKRMSMLEIYTTPYFASFLAAMADIYLDIKFDFYGFFTKGVDWQYLLVFIIIYPTTSFIYLNFFPYQKKLSVKILYILSWSLFTTAFELLATYTEAFYHNEWKLWYSVLCYPVLYALLFFNLTVIRKLAKK